MINDKKYLIKSKPVPWNGKGAMMHVVEKYKESGSQMINPYLNNEPYKMILTQFASELKNNLTNVSKELVQVEKGENFKGLKKSVKSMSGIMKEILGIINIKPEKATEEEKEDFNMKNLWNDVHKMMADKIEERKVEYKLNMASELEKIDISSEKNTVKQILLNLIANALLNMGRGELVVDCKFYEEDQSLIRVWVQDEGKSIGYDEARKINKLLSGKPTNQEAEKLEGSNLLVSKILVDKLGGKIWVTTNNEIGNSAIFTFMAGNDDLDRSIEGEAEISDYDSARDKVKVIPSMNCNEAPFVPILMASLEDKDEDFDCCSNILLVDDNYFNIEVLQSLIEVQLQLNCDSAFNGLEAVNKVKERYEKTCWTKYYKFIFMDVNMPIMDGYRASEEIKRFLQKEAVKAKRDFTKIPTKIFAVTAQKEVIENEQKLFDGIILKPISIEGLRNVLT